MHFGQSMPMRPVSLVTAVLVAIVAITAIFWGSFRYFQSEELSKAEGRLSLYRSTVVAELERFSHLTHVLALDPFVIRTASGGATAPLDARLKGFADRSGLDAIYLMGLDGVTVSASNAGQTGSFLGQNYAFRPYFQTALSGGQGRFYGIGATTGLPGYFIAEPVRTEAGEIAGVVAIKLDLTKLEAQWQVSGEQVLLANDDGVVVLASNPAWRYHVLNVLTEAQLARIRQSRQFTGQPLDPLAWSRHDGPRAEIEGTQRLYLTTSDLPHDWTLHYFASDDRVVARSALVTGGAAMLGAFMLILFQIQRTRRMGAALRRSEEEEAQLRLANERLAIEIEERRTAERRLKRTQGELQRASRLAALGQLAASVTHELGQPIAAMRNHLAAAELSPSGAPRLTGKIGALVDRMEGITRQLKFFARTEQEEFDNVDLGRAMQASLELVAPNVEDAGVTVSFEQPAMPVIVRGNRLRLEQVMTNLLRNAVDAVEESAAPRIDIDIGHGADEAWFEIRDNGHGLGDATLADLQEPFVTTRESGRGMGLGLAISAGIVQDHDGRISAQSHDDQGTVFRVAIPFGEADEAAA